MVVGEKDSIPLSFIVFWYDNSLFKIDFDMI